MDMNVQRQAPTVLLPDKKVLWYQLNTQQGWSRGLQDLALEKTNKLGNVRKV
jgi:hypothetical protein